MVVGGGLFDFNVSLIQTIVIIDFRFEFGLDLDNKAGTNHLGGVPKVSNHE